MEEKILDLPPRIKILEALGTISDKRIKIIDSKNAVVKSSDGSREYKVYIDLEKNEAYSTDNGTKYRGYIGYPIIALLMLQKKLPYNEKIAEALKGIPWKKLNEKYKRYYIVEKIVLEKARDKGVNPEEIKIFMKNTLSQLKKLKIKYVSPQKDITSFF